MTFKSKKLFLNLIESKFKFLQFKQIYFNQRNRELSDSSRFSKSIKTYEFISSNNIRNIPKQSND